MCSPDHLEKNSGEFDWCRGFIDVYGHVDIMNNLQSWTLEHKKGKHLVISVCSDTSCEKQLICQLLNYFKMAVY